jgi:hypothetical protein
MIGPVTLSLAVDLPPGRLDALARDLARDLSRTGATAVQAQGKAAPGERGIAAEIGKLVIEGLGGKAATAALDVVKAYFVRERSLKIVLSKPDGTKVEIDAKNVGSAEVAAFLGAAKDALG